MFHLSAFFTYVLLQWVAIDIGVTAAGVLYPWGPAHGDLQLAPPPPPPITPTTPIAALQLPLNLTLGSFRYFGMSYTNLVLNKQGILSLNGDGVTPSPLRQYLSPQDVLMQAQHPSETFSIFPLLSEVDPYRGTLQYRETTTNRSLLLQVTKDIKAAFPSMKELAVDWALVVTWMDLTFWEPPYYQSPNCSCSPKRNSFQAVLASSGPRSFVVFNYDKILWARNPWSEWEGANYIRTRNCPVPEGGLSFPRGDNASNSVAGFKFDPTPATTNPYYTLPGSVLNLTERSNLKPEVKGRWIFRVDETLQTSSCDFADNIEQVRVEPDYICQLGHVPLRIQGPCLVNVTNVECRFHENGIPLPLITKGVVGPDSSHILCPAPILQTTNGRVRLELAFTRRQSTGVDGVDVKEDRSYSGSLYTYPPTSTSGRKLNLDIRVDGEVYLSWDPTVFSQLPPQSGSYAAVPVNLLLQLTLVVLDLSSSSGGVQFQPPETKIKNSVFNNGSFTWPLGSSGLFKSPKTGYFAYLTPTIADESSYIPSTYLHSDIVYTNISASREEYATLCDDWYWKETSVPDTLPPCPPLLDQAIFDWNFLREWGKTPPGLPSFRQRVPSPGGSCQRCVYSEMEGRLILDPPTAGTADLECSDRYLAHQLRDVLPFHFCNSAGSPESLAKYVEKRSTLSSHGVGYVPPRPSFWRGDPHFTTWDNTTFTFNPVGEFWLVKSADFVVQARMGQYMKTNGSAFTAFVFAQKNPVASVQVSLGGTGLRVWIGRDEIDPPNNPQSQPVLINGHGVSVSLQKPGMELERVTIAFSAGFTFEISLIPGENALNVAASVGAGLKNKIVMTGLLGDFDGVPGNDLRLPVGVTGGITPSNASLADINRWGLNWRTTPEQSIFVYHSGKSHADYQNADFTPNLQEPNISSFPRKVTELCGGLRECLYDYGTTGSLGMAKGTKEFALMIEDVEQVFKRKPPLPCTQPHCVDVTHYTPRPTSPTTPFSGSGGTSDSHGGGIVTGATTKKPSRAAILFPCSYSLRFLSSALLLFFSSVFK